MSLFTQKMRCSCSGNVFSIAPVVYTKEDESRHYKTPDKILTCLTCRKAYLHEPASTELIPISQEPGKKLVRSMVSRNESEEEVIKDFLKTPIKSKKTKKEVTNG